MIPHTLIPPHAHQYGLPTITMLTLPDVDGYFDAVLLWRCLECTHTRHATGIVPGEGPGLTVEEWDAQIVQARATGDPMAQEAARQERRKVR